MAMDVFIGAAQYSYSSLQGCATQSLPHGFFAGRESILSRASGGARHSHRRLPDGFKSGSLKAAIPRDEWKPEMQGGCRDDTVGHIGNNISGNLFKIVRNRGIDGRNEQPRFASLRAERRRCRALTGIFFRSTK